MSSVGTWNHDSTNLDAEIRAPPGEGLPDGLERFTSGTPRSVELDHPFVLRDLTPVVLVELHEGSLATVRRLPVRE